MTVYTSGFEGRIQKDRLNPFEYVVYTEVDPVYIEGPVEQKRMAGLYFSEGLDNFRLPEKQKKALEMLAGDEDGMVFIARHEDTVVGYATFHKPDFFWWQNIHIEELLELGALEIDPEWRGSGIASGLLKVLFDSKEFTFFEDYIVMNIQTVYCWDLRRSGISPWKYRELMRNMLEKFGFYVQPTDDPEIRENSANMLMVRIGSNVSRDAIERFLSSCFSKTRNF